ncbi:AraC family transcriptional regulator [Luteimonas kalidii]|uniref:AraC family transcriptional regulator n=1 Tax=Luteimonas kalidii TaxID=3042025 RepID=A0ABT6JSA3_9GAMM|nr:AraC family transcriptional regulator [Luteimonas kalidii]MDH5833559.1 AraC family transcriptional regulator [Luteimonas kalidii]
MFCETFLDSFAVLRTRDTDELHDWLNRNFAVRKLELRGATEPFDCTVNHCALPSIALTYARYGGRIGAEIAHNDFYLQGFPLSGEGEVQWNEHVVPVRPDLGGIAGGPGSHGRFTYSGDFSNLVLRITPAALVQRLAILLDRPVDPPLKLAGPPKPTNVASYGRLVKFLAGEIEQHQAQLPDMVLSEIEDAVIVNFLFANRHNYSSLLEGTPRAAAPWQVRRAVDYIEQHWDEALTIERLTEITETSARSLFLLFKKTYDTSPMVYLSQVRLRHAREMLCRPAPGASVTKVGFMCGFSNMGNFAMKYYGAFGEKPSETLRSHLK